MSLVARAALIRRLHGKHLKHQQRYQALLKGSAVLYRLVPRSTISTVEMTQKNFGCLRTAAKTQHFINHSYRKFISEEDAISEIILLNDEVSQAHKGWS